MYLSLKTLIWKKQITFGWSSILSLLTGQERDIVEIMFGRNRNHFSFVGVGRQVDDGYWWIMIMIHDVEEWRGGGVFSCFAKLNKDFIGILNSFGLAHIPSHIANHSSHPSSNRSLHICIYLYIYTMNTICTHIIPPYKYNVTMYIVHIYNIYI